MAENTRRIAFEGIGNARDLGGLVRGDGSKVRSGALIRSANLSKATRADLEKLRDQYHLSVVIDLRTSMARAKKPDLPVEGAENLFMPIFTDAMIGVTHENDRDYERRKTLMPDMRDMYRMIVARPECRKGMGKVLTTIMEHDFDRGSVLWHCSEGKDRCGLVAAFLLSALDVSEDQIMEDYLLTNEGSLGRAEWYYQAVLKNGGSEEVAASVRDAFIVKEEYIQAAFDEIRKDYVDIEHYLLEGLAIPEETLQAFREKM